MDRLVHSPGLDRLDHSEHWFTVISLAQSCRKRHSLFISRRFYWASAASTIISLPLEKN
jgi:hypothetical protein